MTMDEYTVSLDRDGEARKCYALNDIIPIALEDAFLDNLMERVKYAVPDLLSLKHTDIKINFKAERLTEVPV